VSQSVQSLYGAMVVTGSRHASPEPLMKQWTALQGTAAHTKAGLTPAKVDLVELKSGLQAFSTTYELELEALRSEVSSDLQDSLQRLQSAIQHELAVSQRLTKELKTLNSDIREVRSALRWHSQQLQRLEVFVGPKAVA